LTIGIPYWDWTRPMTGLPAVARDPLVVDGDGRSATENSWFQGRVIIDGVEHKTARAVDPRLFQKVAPGEQTFLFEQILNALEYHNYCQFEVQMEVAHNSIHYLVGGRNKYSMSHLEYSSYDPLFFLHHSNVDRIYSVYQALQQGRGHTPGPGCTGECENCDVQQFQTPLEPFSRESNPFPITRENSRPRQAHDSQKLGYKFENLSLGGYDLSGLARLLQEKISHDRAFAAFRLYGIKTSVNVRVKVCTRVSGSRKQEICKSAGDFFILGGPLEMPWVFAKPFYFDITKTVLNLGLNLTESYQVKTDLYSVNGTRLPGNSLPAPQVHFRPAKGKQDPPLPHRDNEKVIPTGISVRKDADRLTREEIYELREALQKFQNDRSIDGYQAMAEFHGEPGKCPSPTALRRLACCIHGIPTFPHWHRLFVVQFEDGLRRRGAQIGVPYWDWTKPNTLVPALAAELTFTDPYNNEEKINPFHGAEILFLNKSIHTSRNVSASLTQTPVFGDHTELYDQFLLALEQDNFCDFEVQFEIAHNFIHALVGGSQHYSMASLKYTAFDPLFYLHHSNTDRIWAIWQALQRYRGKPYNSANCAIGGLRKPLTPFSLTSDVNPDPVTRENSLPFKVFDYRGKFHYHYDNLEFNGLSIPQLARVLEQKKTRDRVFVGFLLHGVHQSALVKFYICMSEENCNNLAGEFYLLGDPNEMDWTYDRLYKYDITQRLEELSLHYDDHYYVRYEVLSLNGSVINEGSLFDTRVLRTAGTSHLYRQEYRQQVTTASHVRRDLESLNEGEVESLRSALRHIQNDHTYENIASFHGMPGLCQHEGRSTGCCVHGRPTFPAWHRLYVKQVETALLNRGSNVAVPYWDWTRPFTKLPDLINEAAYFNSRQQTFEPNPFFSGAVANEQSSTIRNPRPELFNNEELYEQTLLALEQDNFCDFEIQFEVLHNRLHSLLGGRARFSMASLDYAAFDPVFFLHHSNTDRIWAIWQELQRYRDLAYNEADCALNLMRTPLLPFGGKTADRYSLTFRY
ncbi:unnamed protein product, partial [Candidula unifasciata]